MKYCTHCGSGLNENAKFCTQCGAPTAEHNTQAAHPSGCSCSSNQCGGENVLEKLCSHLRVSAILLLITAIMQIVGGLSSIGAGIGLLFAVPWICPAVNGLEEYIGQYNTYIGQYSYDLDYTFITQFGAGAAIAACVIMIAAGAFMIAICIMNFAVSRQTSAYIRQIRQSPVGIVQHFQPIGKPVAVLVLNIISGGVLGIIGAAFGLAARCYAVDRKEQFEELEQQVR